jgi:hypothetical protein
MSCLAFPISCNHSVYTSTHKTLHRPDSLHYFLTNFQLVISRSCCNIIRIFISPNSLILVLITFMYFTCIILITFSPIFLFLPVWHFMLPVVFQIKYRKKWVTFRIYILFKSECNAIVIRTKLIHFIILK